MKVLWIDMMVRDGKIAYDYLDEADVVIGRSLSYGLVLLVDDNKEAGLKMIAAGWEFSNSAIRARNQRHLISYHWDTPDVLRQKLDGILPGLEHQESESWVALKPA